MFYLDIYFFPEARNILVKYYLFFLLSTRLMHFVCLVSLLTPILLAVDLHVSAWLCVRLKKRKNLVYGRTPA